MKNFRSDSASDLIGMAEAYEEEGGVCQATSYGD